MPSVKEVHYIMLPARGREDLSFEAALDAKPPRLLNRARWSRFGYVAKGRYAKGRYAEQVADLFERHGRSNVLVLHPRSIRVGQVSGRLPRPVQNAVGRWNARPKSNAPLPAIEQARLPSELAESSRDLELLLGRSLDEWADGPTDLLPGRG